jgi:hypothetical protein
MRVRDSLSSVRNEASFDQLEEGGEPSCFGSPAGSQERTFSLSASFTRFKGFALGENNGRREGHSFSLEYQ